MDKTKLRIYATALKLSDAEWNNFKNEADIVLQESFHAKLKRDISQEF